MNRSLVLVLLVAVGFAAGACRRPEGESEVRPERPRSSSKDPYLIEGEEIRATDAQNLYEVVRARRPAWLTKTIRGVSGDDAVVVYLDDRKLGMLPVLRDMRLDLASRLVYLAPTAAQLRYGPMHGGLAAIVVEVPR